MNNRRILLIAFAAHAFAAPLATLAQQKKVWRVGFLSQGALESYNYHAFQQGMRELGYVEGKNVIYEGRYVAGDFARVPGIAAELLQLKVDAIVVGGSAVHGVKAATRTVPIIMVNVSDPVGQGLVASLARPGGNVTGIASISGETGLRRLGLLKSAIPNLSRVAVLFDPTGNMNSLKMLQAAGEKAGLNLLSIGVRTLTDIEDAFPRMVREHAQALYISSGGLFITYRRELAGLASKMRLPSIYESPPFAESGGLMSYGQNSADSNRRAAIFVDKILRGTNPADLPVEQPMNFELVVNMKTAKSLGLTMPPEIMVQATRVIQ